MNLGNYNEKYYEKLIDKFFDGILNFLPDIITAAIIAVAGFFIIKLIAKLARKTMRKANMDFSLEKFFINCIKVIGYIIIIISVLAQLGISTTGIIACFSAGAAAVALALKDSLTNIASGIVLLFSRPFVTGDEIEFGGEKGIVNQIDIMHTKIITFDNRGLMVPNSVLSSTQVVNRTAMESRRIDITVPVSYDCDIELIKKVLYNTVTSNEYVLSEPEKPFIRLNTFSESSLDFIVKVWVRTENYWAAYHDIMESIVADFHKNSISIPYNQLDVHMIK
ncbi:MAG: mechanosensitive ion channel [Oscillospiraceae bacterium]|nr:mechanosensitive ion channel [Oscillospiraceae bacterium]